VTSGTCHRLKNRIFSSVSVRRVVSDSSMNTASVCLAGLTPSATIHLQNLSHVGHESTCTIGSGVVSVGRCDRSASSSSERILDRGMHLTTSEQYYKIRRAEPFSIFLPITLLQFIPLQGTARPLRFQISVVKISYHAKHDSIVSQFLVHPADILPTHE
jgi:hypothetical protein